MESLNDDEQSRLFSPAKDFCTSSSVTQMNELFSIPCLQADNGQTLYHTLKEVEVENKQTKITEMRETLEYGLFEMEALVFSVSHRAPLEIRSDFFSCLLSRDIEG